MAWFAMGGASRVALGVVYAALVIGCSSSSDDGGGRTTDGGSGAAGKGGSSGGGGSTGGSSGRSGAGGGSGSSGKGGTSGAGGRGGVCGGLLGSVCESNEWCDFPDGAVCGATDVTGTCRPRPTACTQDCPGVCGCDGAFHCNECIAQQAGVDITGDRSCQRDGGSQAGCRSDTECSPGLRCCYPCGQAGCENQCIRPMPNGMCPMYP